jgi:2-polyprenyl-6-hydroxyphenyl methylase/3-demethylubiquinone-9 3-methyltransferase
MDRGEDQKQNSPSFSSSPSSPSSPSPSASPLPLPHPLRLLDVGCGAGVAAEALARSGWEVLGLDASSEAIEAARAHAVGQDLPLAYRMGVAEDLLAEGTRFPVITALEVIEHVPDPAAFVATLAALLAPGGILFLSTLNRTPQSFLAAKVAAEYLLRWLPVGTHDWRRFITPAELGAMLRQVGLLVTDITGLVADPLAGRWTTGRDLSVNYLIAAAG